MSSYGAEWSYIPGNHWVCCDRCGFKKRRTEISKEWDGLMVCTATCLDPPPPQLFTPTLWPEGVPVADPRPEPPSVFRVAILMDGAGSELVDGAGNVLTEGEGEIEPSPEDF